MILFHDIIQKIWRYFLLIPFFVFPVILSAQDTLSLLFAGDIMGHQAQIRAARVGRKQFDYFACFQYMKPVLESVDLAAGNLETTLPGRRPYTGHMAVPVFRSPDALAEALYQVGFDVMLTANNHANDGRRRGLQGTIHKLRQLGFYQTGTFLNEAERAENYPLLIEKMGVRLAFLNATHVGTNYLPTPKPYKVNRFDTVKILSDLEKTRVLKADFTFYIAHWGNEHQLEESEEQRHQAFFLIKNGVDCIVGMHPHVVQPIRVETVFDERTGHYRSGLVAFSLGNFVSNHRLPNTDGGLMLRVNLTRDSTGKIEIASFGFLPVWRLIRQKTNNKKAFFVLPILEVEKNIIFCPELTSENCRKMSEYAKDIRERLGHALEWREKIK